MSHPHRPIDILLSPATLIAVVLAGEALAALLALSPAPVDDRLVLFGLASLGSSGRPWARWLWSICFARSSGG